jgi:hypothetical protein
VADLLIASFSVSAITADYLATLEHYLDLLEDDDNKKKLANLVINHIEKRLKEQYKLLESK